MSYRRRLLDMQLPGGLDAYVTSRRSAGKGWGSIAADINRQLPNEDAIDGNTLRRWFTTKDAA